MFTSELYDLSQMSIEKRTLIEQSLPRSREIVNTAENVKRFIDMQEHFSDHINNMLENCYVYIMPMYELCGIKCATEMPLLAYARCTITGHQIIMMAEEAFELDPECLECFLYHELVHVEQDARGDMKMLETNIVWKDQEYQLSDLGAKVQAAVESYVVQGHDIHYATVIANSEAMPWECEAYYKMFDYSRRFKQFVGNVPEILMNRLTELYQTIA